MLLAYSKMVHFDDLLDGTLIDDEYVGRALTQYFPAELSKRYAAVMLRHPLKREIIATVVANAMINRTGSVFVHRMQEETGASAEDVARAFILVRDIYGFDALWSAIDALDNRVSEDTQAEMLIEAGRLLLRATLWFLRRRRERLPIAEVLAIFQPGVARFRAELPAILSEADREILQGAAAKLTEKGVPKDLASEMAGLDALYAVLDTTEVARETGRPLEAIARVYFALAGELELRWFAERISGLPTDTPWQSMARNAMRDDLASQQRALTASVARLAPGSEDPGAMIAAWKESSVQPIARLFLPCARNSSAPVRWTSRCSRSCSGNCAALPDPDADPGKWRLTAALGVTQVVSWGSVYYAFAVVMESVQDELGASAPIDRRGVFAGAPRLRSRGRPRGKAYRSPWRPARDDGRIGGRGTPAGRVFASHERARAVRRVGRARRRDGTHALRARVREPRPRLPGRSSQGDHRGHAGRWFREHRLLAAHAVARHGARTGGRRSWCLRRSTWPCACRFTRGTFPPRAGLQALRRALRTMRPDGRGSRPTGGFAGSPPPSP